LNPGAGFLKLKNQGSAMPYAFASIQINEMHSRAICEEIGERLRIALKASPPIPPQLVLLMARFAELEHRDSPSIVPSHEDADVMGDGCVDALAIAV
jgi:hypothetical protein